MTHTPLDPVRVQLGTKGGEKIELSGDIVFALPSSALPASALPASAIAAAIPVGALPTSMTAKFFAAENDGKTLYVLCLLLDPEGAVIGSPFNAKLSYDPAKEEVLIIVEPAMLGSAVIEAGSALVFSPYIVPEGKAVKLNDWTLAELPYGQEKGQALTIIKVSGNGSVPGTFADALIIEAYSFRQGDAVLLRGLGSDAKERIDLPYSIDGQGQIIASIPADLEPKRYQVKLLGLAGSDTMEVEILRGEPGLGILWQGELSASPDNPELNWAYYDTSNGTVYLYDGNDWTFMVRKRLRRSRRRTRPARSGWCNRPDGTGWPEWS